MLLPEVEPTYNPHPVAIADDLANFGDSDYQKVVIRLRDLEREVYEMHKTIASVESLLKEYRDILAPAIDGMANSVVGQMLGMKKG